MCAKPYSLPPQVCRLRRQRHGVPHTTRRRPLQQTICAIRVRSSWRHASARSQARTTPHRSSLCHVAVAIHASTRCTVFGNAVADGRTRRNASDSSRRNPVKRRAQSAVRSSTTVLAQWPRSQIQNWDGVSRIGLAPSPSHPQRNVSRCKYVPRYCTAPQNMGTPLALATAWVAFQHDPHRPVRGEEGAHLQDGMGRSHLPLRGKLDG